MPSPATSTLSCSSSRKRRRSRPTSPPGGGSPRFSPRPGSPPRLPPPQPPRVTRRRATDPAIEFARRLGRPARLVISHAAGDEGVEYEASVREFADLLDVDVSFASALIP